MNSTVRTALADARLPESIALETRLDESLPRILLDPGQIHRVFVNLASNAVQAMSEGGRLEVRSVLRGDFVEIEFKDAGEGIPGENLQKIFEPLFTTKAKGIGLGLAIVKSIIDAHGGRIEVESEVGGGTTFTVKLPLKGEKGGRVK